MRRGMGCAGLVCGAFGLAAGLCALFFDFFISPSLDYDSPFNYLTTFFWLFNTLLIGLAVCFIAAGLLAKEPDPAAPRPPDQPPPLPPYGRGFAVVPGFSAGLVTPAVAVPPLPVPSEAPPPESAQAGAGEGEESPAEPAKEGNAVSEFPSAPSLATGESSSVSEKPPVVPGSSAPTESTPDEPEPEKKGSPPGEPSAAKAAGNDSSVAADPSAAASPAEGEEPPLPGEAPRKNPLG